MRASAAESFGENELRDSFVAGHLIECSIVYRYISVLAPAREQLTFSLSDRNINYS